MRSCLKFGGAGLIVIAALGCQSGGDAPAASQERLNPMIALHEQGQPIFGLYAPRATPQGQRGAPEPEPSEVKAPLQLALETTGYGMSDYVFVSSMEGGVDRGLPDFVNFMGAMSEVGANAHTHPLVVKMEKISEDPMAAMHIGQQLNAGVSGVMFVGVESADEARLGLNAMRFAAQGGTRSEDVGDAPAYWGLSEEEYKEKADLWPANPNGELVSWVIVESREGLAHLDEIASVPGITVLWPGAGTLRGVFSTTGADGQRVLDEEGWENAIQQVLAACNAHDLLCGYPSNPTDIEMRMSQGFDVFVMNWGDAGFQTIDMGHRIAGR